MNKWKCYKGWIYLYVNKINGKRYVGQTIQFSTRCKEHARGKDPSCLLDKAIQKYGIDNFKIIILEVFVCNSIKIRRQRLDEKEVYWINKLESFVGDFPDKGYNRTKGGKGSDGYRHPWAKIHVQDYDNAKEWGKARCIAEKDVQKKYYELNREKILANCKVYAAEHKEAKKAYDKNYYLTVRRVRETTPEYIDKRKLYCKKYRETHKEEVAARLKEWRANNKDKMAAQNKLYRQTHWKDEEGHWHKIEV